MNRTPTSLRAFVAAAVLSLSGCAHAPVKPVRVPRYYGTDSLQKDLGTLFKQPYSDTQSMDVIYVTNRNTAGDPAECDDTSFGTSPSDL